MRIAIFVHGGVTESESRYSIPHVREFVQLLAERQDVTVYCANTYERESREYHIGAARVRYFNCNGNALPAPKVRIMLSAFTRDHREAPFDLAHGVGALPAGLTALFAASLCGFPFVTTLIGGELVSMPALGYGNMRRQPFRSLTRFVCSRANTVIVLTAYQQKLLGSLRMKTKRVEVIPYGVNEALFRPSREKPFQPPFNILHIGTLIALKDQETLLRAFAIVNESIECHLRIIGHDYSDGRIQRLSRELAPGARIEFIPYVPNSELPQHFTWARLYLQTSLSEGQSLACTEAMACGTVIGGTSVGILDDLAPTAAFAVPPGDHAALAAKILAALSKPEEYLRLRKRALEWSADHSAKTMVEKHEGLYAALVGRSVKA